MKLPITNVKASFGGNKGVLFLLTQGVLGALGCLTPHQAIATSIYFNDFSGGAGPEWSNSSTAISNGEAFLGASVSTVFGPAVGFGNGSDILTLSGLPAHTDVTVEFDLYVIQSWDGNGEAGDGPDNWQLTADGTNVLFTSFANVPGGSTQAYPNQLPPFGPGGSFAPRTGAFENGHLGFGTGDFGDSTYRFSFTFPHTAPDIALDFTSFQNQVPGDESWGLDNVRVSVLTSPVFSFTGFFQPVDNPPTVNAVKAGRAIPVKFSLDGDHGLDIFAAGYPASQLINCDSSLPLDNIETTVTAGSSSLSYDATNDEYNYVWKTNSAWAGTCRQLIVRLSDGSDHVANFQFR